MTEIHIYNRSKFYKIEPIEEHEEHDIYIYIGLTTLQYLSQRLHQHKTSYKQFLNNSEKSICL